MTVNEAIALADRQRPNACAQTDRILWLSELDGRIKNEILDAREGFEDVVFTGYTGVGDGSTTLLAPHPYDCVYTYWLFTKIDFVNGETARFNNSALMFNTAWINLSSYVCRNYPPKTNVRAAGM